MLSKNKQIDSSIINCKEELNKFKSVVENSPSTIMITGLNGTIDYVNPHFAGMTGSTN